MMRFGTILFRPALPEVVIALVLVVAALSAWYTYNNCGLALRQRLGLWAFRMTALFILAWLLLQAERRLVHTQAEPPVLAIAVDVSASMTEKMNPRGPARSDRALDFLKDRRLAKACARYRIFNYEVGATVEERTQPDTELVFNAPRSNLGTGINQIADKLRAENVAGIILLTDGLDHSGAELSPAALKIPVFIPELEDAVEKRPEAQADYWVADLSYPRMMVVNWKANVDVLVRRSGTGKDSLPIHFRQGTRTLRTSMVDFDETEQFKQVSFAIEPTEVGQTIYEVEIAPKQDGKPDNNKRDFLIDVTDPKNRVLYLEGVPRWEFKFLKRALLAEANYQLSAFVRGSGGKFISFNEETGMGGASVPKLTPDELRAFKVIVLGDLSASALAEEDCRSIRDFVDKGGGLLFLGAAAAYGQGGLQTAPYLQEMFPAVSEPEARMNEGRFTVDLTASGRAHPALSGLPHEQPPPPILSFWGPVKVNELSTTLIATADTSPVLVVRRYGQGRVAIILSDSLWRWQMGGVEDGVEKSLYNRFITQLIYWLAPSEKEVEKTGMLQAVIAKSEVELRENVTIGAVYGNTTGKAGDPLNCKIVTPDSKQLLFPMVPGTLGTEVGVSQKTSGYKCQFTPRLPGKYQVTITTPDGTQQATLLLLATEPEHERTGAPADRRYEEKLAADTGGQFVAWRDRYEMFKDIPFKAKDVQLIEEYPIWNRWWWLGVLVLLFCGEWWWRRHLDMV